jgi:hypothetical protein
MRKGADALFKAWSRRTFCEMYNEQRQPHSICKRAQILHERRLLRVDGKSVDNGGEKAVRKFRINTLGREGEFRARNLCDGEVNVSKRSCKNTRGTDLSKLRYYNEQIVSSN